MPLARDYDLSVPDDEIGYLAATVSYMAGETQ